MGFLICHWHTFTKEQGWKSYRGLQTCARRKETTCALHTYTFELFIYEQNFSPLIDLQEWDFLKWIYKNENAGMQILVSMCHNWSFTLQSDVWFGLAYTGSLKAAPDLLSKYYATQAYMKSGFKLVGKGVAKNPVFLFFWACLLWGQGVVLYSHVCCWDADFLYSLFSHSVTPCQWKFGLLCGSL